METRNSEEMTNAVMVFILAVYEARAMPRAKSFDAPPVWFI